MKHILSIIATFILLITTSCEDGFPTQDKPNLLSDHNEKRGIAFHKHGERYPFSYDSVWQTNCAGASCHQSDLNGGLVLLDGKRHKAPSCYQCHSKLWNEFGSSLAK
jgi:hypothetical protein